MKIGYCVPAMPELASYRLRVAIPAPHLGCEYVIGATGTHTFFYKNGNHRLAESLRGPVFYDVVNDHFTGKNAPDYHAMCGVADVISCASEAMAESIKRHTGRDAAVVDDPYENGVSPPECLGKGVLWFGHAANLKSMLPYIETPHLSVCSNIAHAIRWSPESERDALQDCAVVLLTSGNPGASANRVVKAIRSGRFVVAPKDCADSWRELSPYIWIGDVAEGIAWALNNREDVCRKISQGQKYVAQRFSPQSVGSQWMDLFGSI